MLSLYAGRQGNHWDYCAENTINMLSHRSYSSGTYPWYIHTQFSMESLPAEKNKHTGGYSEICTPSTGTRSTPSYSSYLTFILGQKTRLYFDLCTMFKIVHGLFEFSPGICNIYYGRLQALTDYFCFIDPLLTLLVQLFCSPYGLHMEFLMIYTHK